MTEPQSPAQTEAQEAIESDFASMLAAYIAAVTGYRWPHPYEPRRQRIAQQAAVATKSLQAMLRERGLAITPVEPDLDMGDAGIAALTCDDDRPACTIVAEIYRAVLEARPGALK